MKNDFENNELDNAFKRSVESMEIEPSESFWERTEADLLTKENLLYKKKIRSWRIAAYSGFLLFLTSVCFIYFKYNFLSEKNKLIADAEINNSVKKEIIPEISSIAQKVEGTSQKEVSNYEVSSNKETGTKKYLARRKILPDAVLPHDKNKTSEGSVKNFPIELKNIPGNSQNVQKELLVKNEETNKNEIKSNSTSKLETNENVLLDSSKTINSNLNNTKLDSVKTEVMPVNNINVERNQMNEEKKSFQSQIFFSKISLSAFFSPSITKQNLKDNDLNDNNSVDEINKSEDQPWSYSTGIKLGYDFQKNWTIQTGCYYSVSSFNIIARNIYAEQNHYGSASYSLITSSGVVTIPSDASPQPGDTMKIKNGSTQTLSFVSIPLNMVYNYPIKKFLLYAYGGIQSNSIVNGRTEVHIAKNNNGNGDDDDELKSFSSIRGLKRTYYGFSFGVGAKYFLSKGFFISCEPYMFGTITSINTNDAPVKNHPYVFGAGLGLGYHF